MGLTFHEYQRDPHSGAGNCAICHASERSTQHPHVFTPWWKDTSICVCAQGPEATVHILGPMYRRSVRPAPGSGLDGGQ